jgi:hypothetical protein
MEFLKATAYSLFDVSSIWSVVLRAVIWMVVSIIILMATNNPDPDQIKENTRTYLGSFLMLVVVSSGLIFLLFGIAPQ